MTSTMATTSRQLDLGYLNECFTLTDAGELVWKARPAAHFSTPVIAARWNGKHAGKAAGFKSEGRYWKVSIGNRRYYVHRLVYMLATGADPAGLEIDHVDGDPGNNRPTNLRLATHAENGRNSRKPSNNLSGEKGVGWNKRAGKWCAKVGFNGKYQSALFDTVAAAREWAAEQRSRLHGEFARHQ